MSSNYTFELLDQQVPFKNNYVMISFSANTTVLMQDWSSQITDVEDSALLGCHAEWQVIDSSVSRERMAFILKDQGILLEFLDPYI